MFIDKPCHRRLRILQAAYKAMNKKVLYRKGQQLKRPTGLFFKWHYQVFLFLKLQIKQERKALSGPDIFTGITTPLIPRMELARTVAAGGGWGSRVQKRIMSHEVLWVKRRYIPEPGQGKHRKVISLLEDPDTMLAVREYILQAGESK